MKRILTLLVFISICLIGRPQILPGFKLSGSFNEQQLVIEESPPGVRILINAPLEGFKKNDRVLLVLYALPNGNTIEQTFGKKISPGEDWHFDIQHIAAQTRFLRNVVDERTIVVAYLENNLKSWPAWVAKTPDALIKINSVVNKLSNLFIQWNPEIVLTGHSGGGRFIFSYLNQVKEIPQNISRIAFLDSSYGYEDTIHGPIINRWLKTGKGRFLCALAYNDSIVIYNGKQLVSPTGGTWYRTKMMKNYLSHKFRIKTKIADSLLWSYTPDRRIEIILKPNPGGKIYHTTQVELNGFIHSMLSGTRYENKGYRYFGPRAYSDFIPDSVVIPVRRLNIPVRQPDMEPGSAFMKRVSQLPLKEREEEIYKALSSGNIPGFLRNTLSMKGEFPDSAGILHKVVLDVMPDYLAIGSDSDFCRIPMNPYTAQKLADEWGASLVTSKISDFLYIKASVKLTPFNYIPAGNANELVTKFEEHNAQIEKQFFDANGVRGQLVAGIKKDVILSGRIAAQPGKVVIYGWHKPDGKPIQPVYSGHVWWYVDYSHGIRFINNQVILDGSPALLSDILKNPLLHKIFSDEDVPMKQAGYIDINSAR